jgi:RND superfamily putative drug exporter
VRANTVDPVAQSGFRQLRDVLVERADRSGLRLGFTGGVASVNDADVAQAGRASMQSGLLVAAIVLLSFLFLRGVLAAFLPLLVVGLVAAAAGGLIVLVAVVSGVELDVGTTQVVSVVLIGIGVDYFLFLLFRVRERLRTGEPARIAAAEAGARIGPVIGVAALVLAAASSTLTLASFGQFRLLGPSIAVSVGVMLVAGVTLMPAVAALAGPRLFWPSRRWRDPDGDGWARRLGARIAGTPGRTSLAALALLAALAAFAPAAQLDYEIGGGGPSTPATRTADQIERALSSGAADPQRLAPARPAALQGGDALRALLDRLHRHRIGPFGRPTTEQLRCGRYLGGADDG